MVASVAALTRPAVAPQAAPLHLLRDRRPRRAGPQMEEVGGLRPGAQDLRGNFVDRSGLDVVLQRVARFLDDGVDVLVDRRGGGAGGSETRDRLLDVSGILRRVVAEPP